MILSNRIRRDHTLRLIAVICVIAAGLIVLLSIENMLMSSLLAFVIFYLFSPLVDAFERMGLPRSFSTTLLFLAGLGVVSALVGLVLPLFSAQITALKVELPRYITGVSNLISSTEEVVNQSIGAIYEIDFSESVQTQMLGWATGFFEGLPTVAQRMVTVTILAPFFAFFMILDGRQAARSLLALVPNNLFEMALSLMHQLGEQIGQFIRARLLEAAIVGLVVFVGLTLMDFRFAPLLAIFAALTNLIPYVGPLIGAVPAAAIALINGAPSITLILLLIVYGVAQLIDILFIIPLVVAKIVDLHPVTVVIVIIIGSQVLGIVGMIISIPVASALKLTINAIFTHVIGFRR